MTDPDHNFIPDPDEPDKLGVCLSCNEQCRVTWQDCGIGSLEVWGQNIEHTDFQELSECCGKDWRDLEEEDDENFVTLGEPSKFEEIQLDLSTDEPGTRSSCLHEEFKKAQRLIGKALREHMEATFLKGLERDRAHPPLMRSCDYCGVEYPSAVMVEKAVQAMMGNTILILPRWFCGIRQCTGYRQMMRENAILN